MQRMPVTDRIAPLITTATELFIERGYRRTQMADITGAMGLSPGAVYRYVESKEALFHLVVLAAVYPDAAPAPDRVPFPTPEPGETVALVEHVLATDARAPRLEAALERDDCDDPRAELEGVVREMFHIMSRYRVGIKLADRCALDWPDLTQVWRATSRAQVPNLIAEYLQRRIATAAFRRVPSIEASARLFMELITTFAVHIHWDRFPVELSEADAEEAVVDNLVHALTGTA